jgi:hypothetical protein
LIQKRIIVELSAQNIEIEDHYMCFLEKLADNIGQHQETFARGLSHKQTKGETFLKKTLMGLYFGQKTLLPPFLSEMILFLLAQNANICSPRTHFAHICSICT